MTKQRMSWDEMVENFPNKWVVVANPVMDGDAPDIIEGDVIAVVSDEDIGDYRASHRNQGLKYRRTTESGRNGMFYADFSIKTV